MVIGLCGYAGSGKSEVAKYLEENYKFKRVNFKDGLVLHIRNRLPDTLNELAKIYDMSVDELFKKKPPAMRALMRNIGTDDKRLDNPDHWADMWNETVGILGGNIVADDVRFFNELSAVTEKNGILIRVVREDITNGGDHQSEKEQEKFIEDFTIVAVKGDIEGLHRQIDAVIAHIKAD